MTLQEEKLPWKLSETIQKEFMRVNDWGVKMKKKIGQLYFLEQSKPLPMDAEWVTKPLIF